MAFLDETGLAELWELIKAEDAKAGKVVVGSYVGTCSNDYRGETYPVVTLSFDFAPKFLWLYSEVGNLISYTNNTNCFHGSMLTLENAPTAYTQGYGFGNFYKSDFYNSKVYGKVSNDGKSFSWYLTGTWDDEDYVWRPQGGYYYYNKAGQTYRYIAIG